MNTKTIKTTKPTRTHQNGKTPRKNSAKYTALELEAIQLGKEIKKDSDTKQLDEKIIDFLEEHIPELAEAATKQAYWQALASGSSVLVYENGVIKENFPDGTSRIIEKAEPLIKMEKGQIIKIK